MVTTSPCHGLSAGSIPAISANLKVPMDPNYVVFGGYCLNILMQYTDSEYTQQGLSHGAKEVNPIAKFLLNKLGVAGAGAIKFGLMPIIGGFLDLSLIKHNSFPCANLIMAGITLPVVIWGAIQLKRMKLSLNPF